ERLAAEAICPIDPGGTFGCREQSCHTRHLRVRIDTYSAHDVMGSRSDFHWLFCNIDIGKLLKLMIHARQLAFDVFLCVRKLLLDPRNIEKHATVRTPSSFFDFAHDAARDMVPSQ